MLSKIIDARSIELVRREIAKSERVVILGHISPDGDAIGSSLGLLHYLKELGKEVIVAVPDAYPPFLSWMPGIEHVYRYDRDRKMIDQHLQESDLVFALDFNTVGRVDAMSEKVVEAQASKIMIDHHLHPDKFCDLVISHPEISSTSELIFRVICQLGDYDLLSKNAVECIYTGMMTDTGGFTYNSNKAEIYFIIAELISKGVDKDRIYRLVFNNYSLERMRLQGYLLSQCLKVYDQYPMALMTLSKKDISHFHCGKGDTEGFVNMPLSIKGVVFSAFLREDEDKIKVSLRSVGRFPCNQIASTCFGGGGHLNASGGEFYGTLEEAVNRLEQILPQFKDKFENSGE